MLSPCTGQVAHALLTRPPLRCPMIRPKLPRRAIPVRLACVKHAASVHPEPGSNSHFHLSLPVLTGFTVLFRLYLLLSLRKLYFGNFVSNLRFGSSASEAPLLIPFSEFFLTSLPFSGPVRLEYSGLHYCLFVKVLSFFLLPALLSFSQTQLCYITMRLLFCQQLFTVFSYFLLKNLLSLIATEDYIITTI